MAMLNPMMTTDVAGNPCWMRPGGWTQVGILKTRGCMGSVVKPHKWLLLKRPWEFVKELFRTYLSMAITLSILCNKRQSIVSAMSKQFFSTYLSTVLKVYRFDEPKHYLSCIFNGLRLSRKDHGIYPEYLHLSRNPLNLQYRE